VVKGVVRCATLFPHDVPLVERFCLLSTGSLRGALPKDQSNRRKYMPGYSVFGDSPCDETDCSVIAPQSGAKTAIVY